MAASLALAVATAAMVVEKWQASPATPLTAVMPKAEVEVPPPIHSPPAPPTAKAADPNSDLPSVAVADHPIHDVPASNAATVLKFTLTTPDGRVIAPSRR